MAKEKILVVDDEEDIAELVRYNLAREGYKVLCAYSGEQAMKTIQSEGIDLLVLDLMLPGIDGLEVTRKLKADTRTRHIPIVMLTAKGEEADIVTGLELGADDYITKPFSPRVLSARVKAVIRRQDGEDGAAEGVMTIDGLSIHPEKHRAAIDGNPLELTLTEFQVLVFLARRPGWVYTRSQIVDAVRGDDYPVTDRSVDVQIVGLRKKLGSYASYIETVRGVGYRFKG